MTYNAPPDKIVQVIRDCANRHCHHDRASHYRDARGSGNCLNKGCDCKEFVEEKRDTIPAPKPEHY
jgi:hypothetical protein